MGTLLVEAGVGFGLKFVEGVDAGLSLGAASLWHAAHPLQLGAVEAAGLLDFGTLVCLALGFLLEVVFEAATVVVEVGVGQLVDVVAHMVEEVAVVGYHKDGQPLSGKIVLEPFNHVDVQMVGGLVEDKQVVGRAGIVAAVE